MSIIQSETNDLDVDKSLTVSVFGPDEFPNNP